MAMQAVWRDALAHDMRTSPRRPDIVAGPAAPARAHSHRALVGIFIVSTVVGSSVVAGGTYVGGKKVIRQSDTMALIPLDATPPAMNAGFLDTATLKRSLQPEEPPAAAIPVHEPRPPQLAQHAESQPVAPVSLHAEIDAARSTVPAPSASATSSPSIAAPAAPVPPRRVIASAQPVPPAPPRRPKLIDTIEAKPKAPALSLRQIFSF